MTDSRMAIASLAVSTLSLCLSAGVSTIVRRNSRISEMSLLATLREDWKDLDEPWRRAILTVDGPGRYYSYADHKICGEFTDLIVSLASGTLSSGEGRALARPWFGAINEVIDFMGAVAVYVLRGQLSPRNAYSIFGAEVVRRSRVIRELMDDRSSEKFSEYEPAKFAEDRDPFDWVEQWMHAGQYEGRTQRVLCLQDLLWAQAARSQDLYMTELEWAAQVKRDYGTGLRARKRIRRLCRRLGGGRLTSVRLQWELTNAELVRPNLDDGTFRTDDYGLGDEVAEDLRINGWRRIRLLLQVVR